jgi:hypothetical protein
MASRNDGPLRQIGAQIEKFAGKKVREKVMKDSQAAVALTDPEKLALWVKDAMGRLDALTAPSRRKQIMTACGHECIAHNSRVLENGKKRRSKFATEEAFLAHEIKKPSRGVRYEKTGDVLIQYYVPGSYRKGLRCYCSLVQALPKGVTASPTYYLCALGFTEKYWEGVLGRPVRVEMGETAITGAEECRFTISL